jgi:hypothetical protein
MLAGEETQEETLALALFHKIMLSHLQNDLVKKLKVFEDVQTIYMYIYSKTEICLQTQKKFN